MTDITRESFGITLVFLGLWATLWWLKRRGFASLGTRLKYSDQKREMEMIERLALTPQHSVQLVRVQNRLILLGLHPTGLTVLSELGMPDPKTRESAPK